MVSEYRHWPDYCRRITAVKVYKINNGHLGRLYRDVGITSDSRDYFMSIDAVGNDLRINPIPNCGKVQPMQAKRMSNGGPTMPRHRPADGTGIARTKEAPWRR